MTEILYKYRSLESFKNFVDIILKKRLYAARYKDLNDPMEGQYYYRNGELDESIRERLLREKGELRLCSLSKVNNNELMWSHYADGQRGVAIGLRVNERDYDVREVQYNGLANLNNQDYNNQTAKEILIHKLEIWNYEEEKRVFVTNNHFIDVEIEQIITGRAMSNQDFGFIRDLVGLIDDSITIIKAETLMG